MSFAVTSSVKFKKTNLLFKEHCHCSLKQLLGDSLLLIKKFPGIPGFHFIGHGRMKDCVDLGTTWF